MNQIWTTFLHQLPRLVLLAFLFILTIFQMTSIREQQITNQLLTIIAKSDTKQDIKSIEKNKGEQNEVN